MIKRYGTYFTAFVILVVLGSQAIAQVPVKPIAKPIVKFKPPVVQSFLGTVTGKTATTNAELAKVLVKQPLKVMDDKNITYAISSYHFGYHRAGVKEDEETGKTSPQSDLVSDQFSVTPLPAIWQSNVTETLHTGESLYFFDIIVMDKQGRRFFAPELKITIQ